MSHCLLCGHEHETTGCPQVYSANDYQSLQALYVEKLSHIRSLEAENKRLREALDLAAEAMDERRGYSEAWEWKYGEAWDEEDAKVRAALAHEEGR